MCGGQLDSGGRHAHSERMASSRIRPPHSSPFSSRALIAARLAGAAACLTVVSGCGTNTGGQTGDEHTGSGDVIQELTGAAQRLASSGELPNSASADGWDFGWKFYGAEADPTQNTFFSPYSISVASSMLIAGAAGGTKTEIQAALEFSTDGDGFHQARNSVSQALDARNRSATEDQNAQTLRVVNDLWLDPAFRPLPSFLDTLSAYYGASAYLAPFGTDPEAARAAINEKVATDTEGLIEDLLPENSVNEAVFVLTNAIYFKARWQYQFYKDSTAQEPFTAQSGASVTVPMMHTELLSAAQVVGDDYTAIAVPYDRNELELVAIMPAPGTFDSFVASLDAATVTRITTELEPAAVNLALPKLTIKAKVPLKERLMELGMLQAFDQGLADFSALSNEATFISKAFHDATISIDEEGTVAAAATAFVGVPVSAPAVVIPITLDHPFVFFVRDVQSNALLFVGHYAAP
jgi:serpin B